VSVISQIGGREIEVGYSASIVVRPPRQSCWQRGHCAAGTAPIGITSLDALQEVIVGTLIQF